MHPSDVTARAARHAALADPLRLAIVDELVHSDRGPAELRRLLGIDSNLLAHHLGVLERAGMVARSRSSGDGRRWYVHLRHEAFAGMVPEGRVTAPEALFVCTRNSARSQLAAALWKHVTRARAMSAGTHPADSVHPGAVAAAKRIGLDLRRAKPRSFGDIEKLPRMIVTVCDQAHEELQPGPAWLHWSIPDPVADGSRRAFDATVAELRRRIDSLVQVAS